MTKMQTPRGVEVLGTVTAPQSEILTPKALEFFSQLQREFNLRRLELLRQRLERKWRIDSGELPAFLPETKAVREGDWRVAPVPANLQNRRVEITGPVDRKMIINALNSGANCYMADFEDAHSPAWGATLDGQLNVRDAVRGTIAYTSPEGKEYKLNPQVATLLVRPRGWHLQEMNLAVDGEFASASLFDFALYFFHNAHHLREHGSGIYFYLPKMEHYLEARLWNDVFVKAQELLNIPQGTIKATVLIEHILAAFQMQEILYELRQHSAGLNCGRWDYIFSFIKTFANYKELTMPDRAQVTMTAPFMRAYTLACIRDCHKRGTFAIGGMSAYIPIKSDVAANEQALQKVREDKRREATDGHDGTWVAHPGLVQIAREEFDRVLGEKPNQIDRLRDDVQTAPEQLLLPPTGSVTEAGLRSNISVAIQYLESWLRGQGCVPLYNLMEDAATAEISRTQVWLWVHNRRGVLMADGRKITLELVRSLMQEELARIGKELGSERFDHGRFAQAVALFDELVSSEKLEEFLTLKAYELLEPHQASRPGTEAESMCPAHPAEAATELRAADEGSPLEHLLEPPEVSITEADLRRNISVAIQYLESWLNGHGCVPFYNLMEDVASAVISRAQLWLWFHHRRGVIMADGTEVTLDLVRRLSQEELARIRKEPGSKRFEKGQFAHAARLFDEIVSSEKLEEFVARSTESSTPTNGGPALSPNRMDLNGSKAINGNGHVVCNLGRKEKTFAAETGSLTRESNHHGAANEPASTDEARKLEAYWRNDPRWRAVTRSYSGEKVLRLRGTMKIEHTIADQMSRKLWQRLQEEPYVNALGALSGNQAVQMVQAGLKAIYLSGWQVAADNNLAGSMYPDQSLYPSNSVPELVRRINRALQRTDQIQLMNNQNECDLWAPIVADAEAGFGGPLNAYELVLQMIEAGAAGIHLEDQLASAKKCGHMGGKVLVPAFEFVHKLTAARLAADVAGVPVVLVARTDADSAKLLTSDFDAHDKPFLTGARTEEGFFEIRAGIELAIARALIYAPFADMLWCETGKPDLAYARRFAEEVKSVYPDKLLAYNCSPSFNWKRNLDDATIARFQNELAAMGYRFQFVTLAGFHALNYGMFDLARGYRERQMAAYTDLQQKEFAAEADGYQAVKHQSFVGTGYFDEIATICGAATTQALRESTEQTQFESRKIHTPAV